jgi:hypothetical protein
MNGNSLQSSFWEDMREGVWWGMIALSMPFIGHRASKKRVGMGSA